MSDLMN